MILSIGYSALLVGSYSITAPANLSTVNVADTTLDFIYTPEWDYPNASCELLIYSGATTYRRGINSTVYNGTLTIMNANASFTSSNYVTGLSYQYNCTNTTHYLASSEIFFTKDTRGNFESTLTDLGGGMGSFLNSIGSPVANFILLLSIIGGVVAIFMAIAGVISKAIQKATK